jgi:uncharacterized protein (TIGR03435 family)
VDKTGSKGNYDYKFHWTPQHDGLFAELVETKAVDQAKNPSPDESARASLLAVLKDQLGLELERRDGPFEVLVIDHAEQPTQN